MSDATGPMSRSKRKLTLTIGEPDPGDVLVCYRASIPLLRPENLTGACAECGAAIQYHPSSPVGPRRVCTVCAAAFAPEVEGLKITQRQLDFVRLALRPGGTRR